MGTHVLTDKEVAKIEEAASVVKKFAKYIERVNTENFHLEKNLEESIKAGDVTNEQKVSLRCHENAMGQYERVCDEIKAKCVEKRCEHFDNCMAQSCELHNRFLVANEIWRAARGEPQAWDSLLKWAEKGRWDEMERYR